MFCKTHIRIQVENQAKGTKRKRKVEMRNERNGEAHLHATTWAEHHRGKGLGPPRNRPRKGPPGCGWSRHRHHLSGLRSSSDCMPPGIGGFGWFPILLAPNRPHSTIKEGVELSFNTHKHLELHTSAL
jgi:hypothetical protein